jgi:Outer membrane protein beta-barrel domain
MKKFLSVFVVSALMSVATQLPSQAGEVKKSYVGVGVTSISNVTGFGIVSRIGVSDNISIRPFISILGSSGDTSLYLAGASATYDFSLSNSDFTPYAGLGYGVVGITNGIANANLASSIYGELGADYNAAESVSINGTYKYFFSGGGGNSLGLGVGYRF